MFFVELQGYDHRHETENPLCDASVCPAQDADAAMFLVRGVSRRSSNMTEGEVVAQKGRLTEEERMRAETETLAWILTSPVKPARRTEGILGRHGEQAEALSVTLAKQLSDLPDLTTQRGERLSKSKSLQPLHRY